MIKVNNFECLAKELDNLGQPHLIWDSDVWIDGVRFIVNTVLDDTTDWVIDGYVSGDFPQAFDEMYNYNNAIIVRADIGNEIVHYFVKMSNKTYYVAKY